MSQHGKEQFELAMIQLLQLPEHTTRFELVCAYGSVPIVKCEYEVWPPVIEADSLKTLRKTYEIHLKEIEEPE